MNPIVAILLVGGGYQPFGSQVALEQNMRLFDKVMIEKYVGQGQASVTRLFGAGNNIAILDLSEKTVSLSTEDQVFVDLLDPIRQSADVALRHNNLKNLNGAANKTELVKSMRSISQNSDLSQFRFFYTGHGSGDSENNYANNTLDLWRSEINAKEFVAELDRLPQQVNTQVVMVQCFSGGFSSMNYVGGDIAQRKISSANRCGFFSQLSDRMASGCSEDINFREEYSPYFLAAIRGRTEKNKRVNADYNQDGVVTSNEAHAYVIEEEDSIDVPVTTSSRLLRTEQIKVAEDDLKRPLNEILPSMDADEKHIFATLTSKLGITAKADEPIYAHLLANISFFDELIKFHTLQKTKAKKDYISLLKIVHDDLADRYPLVLTTYGPSFGRGMIPKFEDFQRVKQALHEHENINELLNKYKDYRSFSEKVHKLQSKKAKWERLAYLIKTKFLEAKLSQVSSEVQEKYKQLKACEAKPYL